jgi:Bacteriophage related domain of unknown function
MSNIYDEIRRVLNDRLISQFPIVYGSVIPIGLENQKFVVPQNTPHIRAWTHHLDNKRVSIGTTQRFERKCGIFMVNCYVPEDTGTSKMYALTDAVVKIFTDQKLTMSANSSVITYSPEAKGETKMDGFYFITVMTHFHTAGEYSV